uniref:Ovule protein n=1 Tax=Brugia timori TaxID=42155 RepID=A0A0R3QJR6_9BILA
LRTFSAQSMQLEAATEKVANSPANMAVKQMNRVSWQQNVTQITLRLIVSQVSFMEYEKGRNSESSLK